MIRPNESGLFTIYTPENSGGLLTAEASFSYLRPRWGTLENFLTRCANFDEEQNGLHLTNGSSSPGIIQVLEPILASATHAPSFGAAVEALNAYERFKNQPHSGDQTFGCIPWVSPIPASSIYNVPSIAVMTTATKNNKDLFGNDYDSEARQVYDAAYNASVQEKTTYCACHGYDFHVVTDSVEGRNAGWNRFPALLSLFHQYDWVFHVDLDTVILDHSVRLEEFLDPSHDLIIGVDDNGINNGVFLMRSSTWNRMLLAEAWTLTNEPTSSYWYEQAALMRLMKQDGVRNHMKLVPQEQFNSYLSGTTLTPRSGGKKPFLVHFAGRGDKWEMVLRFNDKSRVEEQADRERGTAKVRSRSKRVQKAKQA